MSAVPKELIKTVDGYSFNRFFFKIFILHWWYYYVFLFYVFLGELLAKTLTATEAKNCSDYDKNRKYIWI